MTPAIFVVFGGLRSEALVFTGWNANSSFSPFSSKRPLSTQQKHGLPKHGLCHPEYVFDVLGVLLKEKNLQNSMKISENLRLSLVCPLERATKGCKAPRPCNTRKKSRVPRSRLLCVQLQVLPSSIEQKEIIRKKAIAKSGMSPPTVLDLRSAF